MIRTEEGRGRVEREGSGAAFPSSWANTRRGWTRPLPLPLLPRLILVKGRPARPARCGSGLEMGMEILHEAGGREGDERPGGVQKSHSKLSSVLKNGGEKGRDWDLNLMNRGLSGREGDEWA